MGRKATRIKGRRAGKTGGTATNGKFIDRSRRAIGKLARLASRARHVDWRQKDDRFPVYAIGDVHGMAELLERLLDKIGRDAKKLGGPARIVFLGDVVNRGPDTRRVLDILIDGPRHVGDEWLVLCGNHELSLLEALSSDDAFDRFVSKGLNTLRSYGLGRDNINRKALKAALPSAHRHFLETLPLTCRTRSHLFVHAGVRPGRPLKRQKAVDLTTIRDPFFEGSTGLPWTVVHGHTPTSGQPLVGGNRICIDTGACITGVLTAVAITEGEKPRFLSVSDKN